ncbi:MAG: hypothetical protein H0V49_02035 [Nocardioidaceae bacterium]|nr:hypothetical protein [Nocardioidaceae bacterium]
MCRECRQIPDGGAFLREIAGDRYRARSAGSAPRSDPQPQVLEALREIGIDASNHVPRLLDSNDLAWADVAVFTCSEEVCPITPGGRRVTWPIRDPKGLPIEEVTEIREETKWRVEELVTDLDSSTDDHRCSGAEADVDGAAQLRESPSSAAASAQPAARSPRPPGHTRCR